MNEEATVLRQEFVPKALMYSCWAIGMELIKVWPR